MLQKTWLYLQISGLVQDCSISSAFKLAMEILQSCTKSSKLQKTAVFTNWWLSARMQYPQCISSGDTAVLH